MEEPTAWNLIRRLFSVLFLGVLAAIAVAGFFLYFFNPSVSFPLNDVLINSEVAKKLNFEEGGVRYIFNRVEFLNFNEKKQTWDKRKLTLDQYKKFYHLIKNDKSETYPGDQVTERFYESNPAIMSIVVRKEGSPNDQVFQEVQISPKGDVYRVKLRQEQKYSEWAYFQHKDIYQKVLKAVGGD